MEGCESYRPLLNATRVAPGRFATSSGSIADAGSDVCCGKTAIDSGTDAQITPVLRESAHLTSGMLPEDMRKRVVDNLPDAAPVTEELQEAGEAVGESLEDTSDGSTSNSGGSLDLLSDEGGN